MSSNPVACAKDTAALVASSTRPVKQEEERTLISDMIGRKTTLGQHRPQSKLPTSCRPGGTPTLHGNVAAYGPGIGTAIMSSVAEYHNPRKCCFLNKILATDFTNVTKAGSCICAHR